MTEQPVVADFTPVVRCAFVGDEPLVAQCAEIAQAHGLSTILLATTSQVVRRYGEDNGITVVGRGPELADAFDGERIDVLFSIANEQTVSDEVLERAPRTIHLHDGPVPDYVGLNVTTWAILHGEREHAITWHLLPGGEVVATERFAIAADDTAFSLNARCYEAALSSFPRIAASLAAGEFTTSSPPSGEPHRFTERDRPALVFSPTTSASETERSVRALDLGHRTPNNVGSVRWVLGDEVLVIEAASVDPSVSGAPAGTLVALDDGAAIIATAEDDLRLHRVTTPEGGAVALPDALDRHGVGVGSVLPSASAALAEAITELEPDLAGDESFWLDRFESTTLSAAPTAVSTGSSRTTRAVSVSESGDELATLAAFVLWLARTTSASTVAFGVTDDAARAVLERTAPLTRPGIALVDVDPASTFVELRRAVATELDTCRGRMPLLRDAIGRDPRTRGAAAHTPVVVNLDADTAMASGEGVLAVAVGSNGLVIDTAIDPTDPGAPDRMIEQISTLLAAGLADPSATIATFDVLGPVERALLDEVNRTDLPYDRDTTVDGLFHTQVRLTPDAPALTSGARTLTYADLESEVRALVGRLAAAGVQRGDRVGIALPRGIDMVVGVLATLDLGAAYLPLDPTYPAERLAFMVDDAGIVALLAVAGTVDELERPHISTIDPTVPGPSGCDVGVDHDPTDLAYVIYTSGSTGLPKGVMLEHRQVTNFFAAMDQVIDRDPPGVWLAVTSLSFDISVLELLWTLTRGFHVVVKSDRGIATTGSASSRTPAMAAAARPVSFSLFYFAAGEEAASDGYRLLLDSARFADRHGFEAVWTPERHFHAFGGAYPNPSVTGAALAAVTEHVGIRAGSVVLPLHSPIRVAEEWAVVDNISRGRVAISFAAGWQPNDFVLNPSAYATAKDDLARNIRIVERLWRGEKVELPGHDGEPVEVGTLPRPWQATLPVWLTSAGSPATFERAGELGVNVLTHLLGQSVEQLGSNIESYRAAWRDAGHPGEGRVTLMMHTYLDRDADVAREVAREPMKRYLGTAVGLLRNFATAFPIFAAAGKDSDDLFASLTDDELDQLLEMAAHRYLSTSGLFGTPEEAAAIVEAVSEVGVDEVACLIDFGIDTDSVFSSLELLLETKSEVDERRATADETVVDPSGMTAPAAEDDVPLDDSFDNSFDDFSDDSVAALVARHGVTHLQCTPSLAAMLVADRADRAALGDIRHLMLGGEALPSALADELRALLPGRFTNMYGPTETTIWSLTHEIDTPPGSSVPVGRPIANTTIFVLDPDGRRLPLGALGELHIGGEGVARGYHDRHELTSERFVDRLGMGRVYATGDMVRIDSSGIVEFAGRADNQVKIRGHRVELGEIESVLDRHPDVVQSVVVAHDDRGDVRLVAYVVTRDGMSLTSDTVRAHVGTALPDAMIPAAVVRLDSFPLTPNGKIDRKALPADAVAFVADAPSTAPPVDDTERLVADVWSEQLGRAVGRDDSFFDIGGHSLLAVKVFRQLSERTGAALSLTDVFRFPTVRTFAAHLGSLQGTTPAAVAVAPAAVSGTDRGAMRRRALTRRGRGSEDEAT